MANVKAAGAINLSFNAQVTRNSDGTLSAAIPGVALGMSLNILNFTQMDQGLKTASLNELDLTALNLDGSGAKDLTGLYIAVIVVPVPGSGSGTMTAAAGTTTPYLCGFPTLVGDANVLSQATAFRIWFGDAVVASGAKTLDFLVSGTLSFWIYVFAGPNRF